MDFGRGRGDTFENPPLCHSHAVCAKCPVPLGVVENSNERKDQEAVEGGLGADMAIWFLDRAGEGHFLDFGAFFLRMMSPNENATC